jgi:hypothetical protein
MIGSLSTDDMRERCDGTMSRLDLQMYFLQMGYMYGDSLELRYKCHVG